MRHSECFDRIQSFKAAKIFLSDYYWKNETTELRTIASGMILNSRNIAADAYTLRSWGEAVECVRQFINEKNAGQDDQTTDEFMQLIPLNVAFFSISEYLRVYNLTWKSEHLSAIISDVESARAGTADVDQGNPIWHQWMKAVSEAREAK